MFKLTSFRPIGYAVSYREKKHCDVCRGLLDDKCVGCKEQNSCYVLNTLDGMTCHRHCLEKKIQMSS